MRHTCSDSPRWMMSSCYKSKSAVDHALHKLPVRGRCLKYSSQNLSRHSIPPFNVVPQRIQRNLQCRYFSKRYKTEKISWRTKLQSAVKESPVWLSVSVVSLLISIGFVFYTFVYYPRKLARDFDGFPDRVGAKLRLALWYTHDSHWDPDKALQNYKEALLLAQKFKMDPFGDQYFGMRLKVAGFLEKLGNIPKAVELLEQDRATYLKAIEAISNRPDLAERRGQILFKAVGLHAKLAEYYSHETISDDEAAEERLVWAVTTILKENEGLDKPSQSSENAGTWINKEQTGGTLEGAYPDRITSYDPLANALPRTALANFYESKNRHFLSTPLYLQALAYSPPSSCHSVILMNNLATSLALQHPPSTPNTPAPSAADQVASARSWVHRALKAAAEIKPPQRTDECDQGCAVATINLGDLALMEGDVTEARRRFEEGRSLCKAIGFQEGLAKAASGIRQLEGK